MAKYLNRDGVKRLRKNLKNEIPTKTSELENNSGFITENDLPSFSGYTKSETDTLLAGKSNTGHTHTGFDITDLATVATTGDYSDLTNKPVVETDN